MSKNNLLIGKAENEKIISGDMFTLEWIKEIDTKLLTMIAVSWVYQYFYKEKIVEMIKKMKSFLPKGELVFDATNTKGLKIANKYVRKTFWDFSKRNGKRNFKKWVDVIFKLHRLFYNMTIDVRLWYNIYRRC